MRTRTIEVEVYEPDEGKVLAVYHDGYDFPVYYDRVFTLFLGENDIVKEIERRCLFN